jgi:hypothetical protein
LDDEEEDEKENKKKSRVYKDSNRVFTDHIAYTTCKS